MACRAFWELLYKISRSLFVHNFAHLSFVLGTFVGASAQIKIKCLVCRSIRRSIENKFESTTMGKRVRKCNNFSGTIWGPMSSFMHRDCELHGKKFVWASANCTFLHRMAKQHSSEERKKAFSLLNELLLLNSISQSNSF